MIKSINNISFKAVYRHNTQSANENQKNTMNDIKQILNNNENPDNFSVAEKYEKKNNIHFLIKPAEDDKVIVEAIKNLKMGNCKYAPSYKVVAVIGKYSSSQEFSTNDVDKKLDKVNNGLSIFYTPIEILTGLLINLGIKLKKIINNKTLKL